MAGAIGYVAGLSIRNSSFTLTGTSLGVHGQTCSNVTIESCCWTGASGTTMARWEYPGTQNCSALRLRPGSSGSTTIYDHSCLGNVPTLLKGTLASASSIVPSGAVHKVSGTTTISTIDTSVLSSWWDGSSALEITLIFLSACSVTTGGNILRAVTYAANQAARFLYIPGFGWYPY